VQLFRSKQVCVGKTKSASLPNRRFLYFFLIALAFAHLFAIEYTQNINAFIANINTPQHTSINTHPHLHMYVTCAGKQATRKIPGPSKWQSPRFRGCCWQNGKPNSKSKHTQKRYKQQYKYNMCLQPPTGIPGTEKTEDADGKSSCLQVSCPSPFIARVLEHGVLHRDTRGNVPGWCVLNFPRFQSNQTANHQSDCGLIGCGAGV